MSKPLDTSVLDFEWPLTHSRTVPEHWTQKSWITHVRRIVHRRADYKAAEDVRSAKAEALRLQRELASGVLDSSGRSARYRELVQGSGALSIGIVELEACNAQAEVMAVHARLATRILSVKCKIAAAQRKITSTAKGFDSAHAAFHEQWTQAKSTLGVNSPYLACLSGCKVDEAALHKDELQDRRTFEPIIARMLSDSANAAKPLPAQRAVNDTDLGRCVNRITHIRKRNANNTQHVETLKMAIAQAQKDGDSASAKRLQDQLPSFESRAARCKATLQMYQAQRSELQDAAKAAKVCVRSRFERLACRERGVAALLGKVRALVDGVARMAAERASLSATSRPSKRARRSARAAESAAAVKDGDSDDADASSSSSYFSSSSDEEGLEAIYSCDLLWWR